MCGLLYARNVPKVTAKIFTRALATMALRGPDQSNVVSPRPDEYMGHTRLELIGGPGAAQPIASPCGRFYMIYNGELYNTAELAAKYNIDREEKSDTRVIINLFSRMGVSIFPEFVGMFAILIVDHFTGDVYCARDRIGIKPLYYYEQDGKLVIASMTVAVRALVTTNVCEEGLAEWKDVRRQIPGSTFFKEIREYLPGRVYKNNRVVLSFDAIEGVTKRQFRNEAILEIISSHLVRDEKYDYASFLSGGVDSSIITKLTKPAVAYTAGSNDVNEFKQVEEFAEKENQNVVYVNVNDECFKTSSRELLGFSQEPSTLPNEILIYEMCKSMPSHQKIIFSGEGADEFFFGYDRLVNFCMTNNSDKFLEQFLARYRYRHTSELNRFKDYLSDVKSDASSGDFIEDFLIKFHLSGLLKRADHATMAASKECRVPFSDHRMLSFTYRVTPEKKLNEHTGKLQLRRVASSLGLSYLSSREKRPFSYQNQTESIEIHYEKFQTRQLEALGWY